MQIFYIKLQNLTLSEDKDEDAKLKALLSKNHGTTQGADKAVRSRSRGKSPMGKCNTDPSNVSIKLVIKTGLLQLSMRMVVVIARGGT